MKWHGSYSRCWAPWSRRWTEWRKTEASARANDLHRLQRERTGQELQRVCLPRCVLQLASCCRTILKADWKLSCMYKPEKERVSFTKMALFIIFWKQFRAGLFPKKQASLIVSALHSHTPTFPYLALRHFPQLRWFRYERNYSKLSVSAQKRTQAAFTTNQEMFGIIWILAQSYESDWVYISPDLKIPSCSLD